MPQSVFPGYDPENFENYSSLSDIYTRLEQLDPLNDNIHVLVHLNREASKILAEKKPEGYSTSIQKLGHTLGKEIKLAATCAINQERIDSFKEGLQHTKIEVVLFILK